jgi:hypothetical protein
LRRKKKTMVAAGSRSSTSTGGATASKRSSSQLTGKRKNNELASSGETFETANLRPAPGDASAPLPASELAVTCEQAAACSRPLGLPEGGVTYVNVLAGPVAPFQASGSLKPTAIGSDQSEPAVSSETDNRRKSSDMSGPLSDKPDGTTQHAQVANTCLPAGQRPNKTPIFITGVSDAHTFLAWLRATCPGGPTAQLKGEKLMVVPSTADGSEPWSAHCGPSMGGGESFHTFTLPEDRCVWLLVKKLGMGRPETVIREELVSLSICVQGVMQLRSGRRNQDPAKDHPPKPHSIVSVARGPEVSKVRSLSELCGIRLSVETYVAPKGPLQCKRCQRFGQQQRNCGYAPRCVAFGGSRLSGGCSTSREQPQCCGCGGNHTAKYRGCIK